MRVRHIARHIGSQNWMAVGIDLLIVVLGVFLGLQAQDWNQRRQDRDAEQAYLARLESDFDLIESRLRQCLATYRNSFDALGRVKRAVAGEDDGDSLAGSLIAMTADTLSPGRSATFVEMLSSGDLSILRDEALRNALVAYDEQAQFVREVGRSRRDEDSRYMRPLYEHVDLEADLGAEPYASITDYDLDAMSADPDFRMTLEVLAGSKANSFELCNRQLDFARRAREQIAASRRAR